MLRSNAMALEILINPNRKALPNHWRPAELGQRRVPPAEESRCPLQSLLQVPSSHLIALHGYLTISPCNPIWLADRARVHHLLEWYAAVGEKFTRLT